MFETVSVALGALLLQMPAIPTPLSPSGKWTVSYEPVNCVVSREFGVAPTTAALAITPAALGDDAEIAVIVPDEGRNDATTGQAMVTIGGLTATVDFNTQVASAQKLRVSRFFAKQSDLMRVASAPTMTLAVTRGRNVTLPTTGFAGALKATETCRADLRKAWGIDADAFARVVEPARAIRPADWLTHDDYPMSALQDGQHGEAMMVWSIDIEGHVKECRTVRSSGSKLLDDISCAAIKKRGRYVPATDLDGKPVISWSSRRVRWRLPF